MNRANRVFSLLLSVVLVSACHQDGGKVTGSAQTTAQEAPQTPAQQAAVATASIIANGRVSGAVSEIINSGGYTYARVDVEGQSLWAAGPTTPMAVGDTISFSTLMPMQNFHSNTMNRDFPILYFVDGFTAAGSSTTAYASVQPPAVASAALSGANADVSIEKIEKVTDGYTIAEVLAQRAELVGKPIKVRGKVTKFTPGIMGKNWLHIVDGSGPQDLIVTTSAATIKGAVVVVEGVLLLDRDFGYGYRFDVLMEDANVRME